jgi:hypothetical protein
VANHEQPDVLEHLSDLSRLEKTLGAKVGYQVLEPFEIDRTDPFPVQKALRTIIHFLRLPTMIAIVVNQKAGIAGHIEVGENYIEVDESTAASTERLLATLAHEVTHKYWDMNDMTSRLGQSPLSLTARPSTRS